MPTILWPKIKKIVKKINAIFPHFSRKNELIFLVVFFGKIIFYFRLINTNQKNKIILSKTKIISLKKIIKNSLNLSKEKIKKKKFNATSWVRHGVRNNVVLWDN